MRFNEESYNSEGVITICILMVFQDKLEMVIDVVLAVTGVS